MTLLNAARGEVALTIDGSPVRLCLTLGALAELEAAFGGADLGALAQRLAAPRAQDLLVLLAALAKGGGTPLTPTQVAGARIDPVEAATAIAAAFDQAFGP
jgi:hypothetical protein